MIDVADVEKLQSFVKNGIDLNYTGGDPCIGCESDCKTCDVKLISLTRRSLEFLVQYYCEIGVNIGNKYDEQKLREYDLPSPNKPIPKQKRMRGCRCCVCSDCGYENDECCCGDAKILNEMEKIISILKFYDYFPIITKEKFWGWD